VVDKSRFQRGARNAQGDKEGAGSEGNFESGEVCVRTDDQ
jgi:hypothetical protein